MIGVKGALLSRFFAAPLRPSTVVVGRKFVAARCARAAQAADAHFGGGGSDTMRWVEARHTLERARARDPLAVAAVRGGAIGRERSGDGDECLSWDAGERDDAPRRRHDGRTGRPLSVAGRRGCARSPLSSAALFADYAGLLHGGGAALSGAALVGASAAGWGGQAEEEADDTMEGLRERYREAKAGAVRYQRDRAALFFARAVPDAVAQWRGVGRDAVEAVWLTRGRNLTAFA